MATNPVFDKVVGSVEAVAKVIGEIPVNSFVHRIVMLASAAAVAGSAYIGENAILLDMTPTTVAYVSAAVAAVTTFLRIFTKDQ